MKSSAGVRLAARHKTVEHKKTPLRGSLDLQNLHFAKAQWRLDRSHLALAKGVGRGVLSEEGGRIGRRNKG